MATPPRPIDAVAIDAAIDRSEPLSRLLAQLRGSRALFDEILPLLPASLAAEVRPGSLDGTTWTLLANHGSAAAKVRQLLPVLLQHLQRAGRELTSIKLRVQPRLPRP